MSQERILEVESFDPGRLALLFGGGRLLLGALCLLAAALGAAPAGVTAGAELIASPLIWLAFGFVFAQVYNLVSARLGGVRLRAAEGPAAVAPVRAEESEPEPTRVEWSYVDGEDKVQGPFEDQAFRALIDRGVVGADTRVSRAVRNLVSELIMEDRTRRAREHPELAARLRSAAGSGAQTPEDRAAEA